MYDPWFRFRVQTAFFAGFAVAAALALVLLWRGDPWGAGTMVASTAAAIGLLLTLLTRSTFRRTDARADAVFSVLLCAGLAYLTVAPRFFGDLTAQAWPLVFAGLALAALATPLAELACAAGEAARRKRYGAENAGGVDRREVANAFGVKERNVRFARFDGGDDALACPLVILERPADDPAWNEVGGPSEKKRWTFSSLGTGPFVAPMGSIEEMARAGLREDDPYEKGFYWLRKPVPLGAALVLADCEEGELIAMSDERKLGGGSVVVFRATEGLLFDGRRWLKGAWGRGVRLVPSGFWGTLAYFTPGPCAAATMALLTIALWA